MPHRVKGARLRVLLGRGRGPEENTSTPIVYSHLATVLGTNPTGLDTKMLHDIVADHKVGPVVEQRDVRDMFGVLHTLRHRPEVAKQGVRRTKLHVVL